MDADTIDADSRPAVDCAPAGQVEQQDYRRRRHCLPERHGLDAASGSQMERRERRPRTRRSLAGGQRCRGGNSDWMARGQRSAGVRRNKPAQALEPRRPPAAHRHVAPRALERCDSLRRQVCRHNVFVRHITDFRRSEKAAVSCESPASPMRGPAKGPRGSRTQLALSAL